VRTRPQRQGRTHCKSQAATLRLSRVRMTRTVGDQSACPPGGDGTSKLGGRRRAAWSSSCSRNAARGKRGIEVDGGPPLRRWVKPHDSVVRGSATYSVLDHGLNGTSNSASRHRLRRPHDRGHATHRKSLKTTIHLYGNGTRASLEGSFIGRCSLVEKGVSRRDQGWAGENERAIEDQPG